MIARALVVLLLVAFLLPSTAESNEGLLGLINGYRAENGVPPLVVNDRLQAAAEWMASDMLANDYVSHTDSLGRWTGTRLQDFDYSEYTWGEVIAAFVGTDSLALQALKESPSHNAAMLDSTYTLAGVGVAEWYWVVDMGVAPAPLPPPSLTPSPPPVIPLALPRSGGEP